MTRPRKEITLEIGDLCEKYCDNCDEVSFKTPEQIKKTCQKCPIGQRLYALGQELLKVKSKKVFKITKEWYLAEREKGLTDKQICKNNGLKSSRLTYHKKKWGMTRRKKGNYERFR